MTPVLAQLHAKVDALAAQRQPRAPSSAMDVELVAAIFAAYRGTEFRAFDLALATDSSLNFARLRLAIEAAVGSLSTRRIGKRLRALAGLDLGGLTVTREGEDREGVRWSIAEVRK